MTEKKKRVKVVAEISLAHFIRLGRENGRFLSSDEALAFFNTHGNAYYMWRQMMHAGEEFIKSILNAETARLENLSLEAPESKTPVNSHASIRYETHLRGGHGGVPLVGSPCHSKKPPTGSSFPAKNTSA